MSMSGATITYKIPLYSERPFIGEFKSVYTKDGYLVVSFEATNEAKEFVKPPIVFQQTAIEIRFD